MELRVQSGEFSILGSTTGMGQAFRQNEIRLALLPGICIQQHKGGKYQ
jgi:precorrin-4 methylase